MALVKYPFAVIRKQLRFNQKQALFLSDPHFLFTMTHFTLKHVALWAFA